MITPSPCIVKITFFIHIEVPSQQGQIFFYFCDASFLFPFLSTVHAYLDITYCGIALDLLCLLDCDFLLGIHLVPYHKYDQSSLLQCHQTNSGISN